MSTKKAPVEIAGVFPKECQQTITSFSENLTFDQKT
jgi:hypothetical protein